MLVTCVVAGLILTILAPLGTDTFSVVNRLIFWTISCLAGGLGAGMVDLVIKWRNIKLNVWVCALAQSMASSIAVFCVLSIFGYLSGHTFRMLDIPAMVFYIWVISMTISSIAALQRVRASTSANAPENAALFERLPPKLKRAELYALSAEDHYVRVRTSQGDALVLMRLTDAIKETTPLKGVRTHRSWWVAEAGIDKITSGDLTLHSGQTVPISRSGKKAVRDAGWL